jgi:hypothetical protein
MTNIITDSRETLKWSGRSMVGFLTTTRQVRDLCRLEGVGRLAEAFVVEGFKLQRQIDGLSENV